MNQQDASRVAARLHSLANLVDTKLIRALTVSHGWRGPLRAAGSRQGSPALWCETHERDLPECHDAGESCRGVPVAAGDPTGEAAIGAPPDQLRHARLVASWQRIEVETAILARLILSTTPQGRQVDPDGVPDGACKSCWRVARYFEPVAVGQYGEWCRWCGDFRTHHDDRLPPVELLERRHRGQKISTRDVAQALTKTKRKKAG